MPHPDSVDQYTEHLDNLYYILKTERRRLLLVILRERDDPVSCREISHAIAAVEEATPRNKLGWKDHKRPYSTLCQTHLPKLKSLGFVDYDRPTAQIEPGANLEAAITYLSSVDVSPTPYDNALTRLEDYTPETLSQTEDG